MSIDRYYDVLISPVVSEKSTLVGEQSNQYVFKVSRRATKDDVKKAIELFFNVTVTAVQILNRKGKEKRFGRTLGRRAHEKKAYVSLKDGETIKFGGEA
tara:strand:- start:392 stop:688 length:297 start_codon:yes stop_codon:yes gene_type:complete